MTFVVVDERPLIEQVIASRVAGRELLPHPEETNILKYLLSAQLVCGAFHVPRDQITPQEFCQFGPSLYTDGVYIWPLVVCHYVRVYHGRIPDTFVERMLRHGWVPPSISEGRWNALLQFREGPDTVLEFPDAGIDMPRQDEL